MSRKRLRMISIWAWTSRRNSVGTYTSRNSSTSSMSSANGTKRSKTTNSDGIKERNFKRSSSLTSNSFQWETLITTLNWQRITESAAKYARQRCYWSWTRTQLILHLREPKHIEGPILRKSQSSTASNFSCPKSLKIWIYCHPVMSAMSSQMNLYQSSTIKYNIYMTSTKRKWSRSANWTSCLRQQTTL